MKIKLNLAQAYFIKSLIIRAVDDEDTELYQLIAKDILNKLNNKKKYDNKIISNK